MIGNDGYRVKNERCLYCRDWGFGKMRSVVISRSVYTDMDWH